MSAKPRAASESAPHFFAANLSGFLVPRACVFSDCGTGGLGMTPACPNSRPTVCDGCAPTDSQYLRTSCGGQVDGSTATSLVREH